MINQWFHTKESINISGKIRLNKGDLYRYLRHQLKHRKRPLGKHRPIANRVSIDERDKVVEQKNRFGDWEMDTIIGANQKGAILTLTERKTNFIIIQKLQYGKNSKKLSKHLTSFLQPYKKHILGHYYR